MDIDYLQNWFDRKYQQYWTYPKTPRDAQLEILFQVEQAIKKGYRNIIIEAGTGVGKSPISTTIAKKYAPSYILTKTVNLQEQYMEDYSQYLCELKGKKHYPCWYDNEKYKRHNNPSDNSCENCYIDYLNDYGTVNGKKDVLNEHGRDFKFYHEEILQREYDDIINHMLLWKCKDCIYTSAIKEAIKNDIVIANYHSLYYNSYFISRFKKRNMIIFDECHNFEEIMMKIPIIKLNASRIYDQTKIDVFNATKKELKSTKYWIRILKNIILNLYNQKEHQIGELTGRVDDNIIKQVGCEWNIKINTYEKNMESLQKGEWINEIKGEQICFKPIYGKPFSERLLNLGTIRIFLSGTLPSKSKYLTWLGLDKKYTKFIYKKSPFEIINRPIIKKYLGNFKSKNDSFVDGERIPAWHNNNVLNGIINILSKHVFEKGIIHTTSTGQTEWLNEELTHKNFNVIVAYNDSESNIKREEQIIKFKNNPNPCVLIGPAIKEGVDFKGDLCTYQIIFKVPNPYYGDTQIRARAGKHDGWYKFMTTVPLMQAYGRGIRTPNDKCICYVIDSDFESLIRKNKQYFCEYFLEAII